MSNGEHSNKPQGPALIAALVVLAAWLGLVGWLTFHAEATDIVWARLFSVLSSLEAVAFAAAGALFGTTIQKQRVKDARDQAEKSDRRASEAEKNAAVQGEAAVKGKALALAVKARATKRTAAGDGLERVSATAAQAVVPEDLVALAQELFPA